jgi:hypothetical protein
LLRSGNAGVGDAGNAEVSPRGERRAQATHVGSETSTGIVLQRLGDLRFGV